MRKINRTSKFKKDFKRVAANSHHSKDVRILLKNIVFLLANNSIILQNNHDHALVGNWTGYRECHIKPDLLLIYKLDEPNLLRLMRLGSHSELFK